MGHPYTSAGDPEWCPNCDKMVEPTITGFADEYGSQDEMKKCSECKYVMWEHPDAGPFIRKCIYTFFGFIIVCIIAVRLAP